MDGVDLRFAEQGAAGDRRLLPAAAHRRAQPAHHRRGDLPRHHVRGARAQGRDDHRRRRRGRGAPGTAGTAASRAASEDLRAVRDPESALVLVRVLSAQDRSRGAGAGADDPRPGRAGAGVRVRHLRRGRFDAREDRRSRAVDRARGGPDGDGAPDLRRGQPGGDRRGARPARGGRHRERHGAARRPARRADDVPAHARRFLPTRPIWSASSASGTAASCAWAAPATPRATSSAATSIGTSPT